MAGMPPAAANFGIGGDRSFTGAEPTGRVRRLANGLQRRGMGRGARPALERRIGRRTRSR